MASRVWRQINRCDVCSTSWGGETFCEMKPLQSFLSPLLSFMWMFRGETFHTCVTDETHSSNVCKRPRRWDSCSVESWTLSFCSLSSDIDECATQMHYCQSNTACVNLPGSHRCDCLPGFIRVDEYSCTGTSAPAVWRSSVVANEVKVFFWSAGITSSLFKCSFNKPNEI